jgi:NADPH2:quinone reductase
MRVVTASQYGFPDVLHAGERPVPQPKPGEVVVAVKAVGINLTDTLARRGAHPSFTSPLTLGVDGADVVVAAGDQATAKAGDRVSREYVPGAMRKCARSRCAGPLR